MISPGIDRDRITPEWLTKLTEPIEALYTALQRDLIVNIARQFNVFGRKANVPTSYAWRGYMLGQLGGLTKENYDTIARYSGDISEATRLAVQTSVEASVGVVDRAFMEEILDAEYVPEITETTERVTGYYVNQALEKQNLVNTVMLNSTRRYYEQAVGATSDALDQSLDAAQQALNAAAGGVIHGTTDFYSALRDCVRDMADRGLTGFYDKAGREWSAQAYVTMDMRTTAANAAREAAMERNREYGNELIAVSSHPGARPLCEPYQGGVYSTDGSTGETTDVHGASISYYPLELTSYGEAAGLFGINCGHYPSPFIPGLSVVRKLDISHEENERLYKESQHQRYMERRVRAAKIEADALKAAGDAEGAKAARAKARERNAELKGWCAEKGRAYYPEKVRVVRAEKTSTNESLTSRVPSGTIESYKAVPSDWQDVRVRNTTTIQHGFSAYPEGDLLNVYTKKTIPEPGFFDVAMHGTPVSVGFGSQNSGQITARELANFIRHRDDYHGEPIRLLCCNTGEKQDDDYCFAEHLANALGVMVIAPDAKIYFKPNGEFYIGVPGNREFERFKPNQRRRIK